MSALGQAVAARLDEMRDLFTSGLGELTGKAQRIGERGELIHGARFGGVKSGFPELRDFRESPGVIARAIERGSGPLYESVTKAVRGFLGDAPYRKPRIEKSSVLPHGQITRKCRSCGVPHGKGAHRFHGRGSWLRTHLFPFKANSMRWTERKAREYLNFYLRLKAKVPLSQSEERLLVEARQFLRRIRRRNPNPRKGSRSVSALVRTINEATSPYTMRTDRGHALQSRRAAAARKILRSRFVRGRDYRETESGRLVALRNPRRKRNPDSQKKVTIYRRLLRIEAQKLGPHRCDAECKRKRHCYYHDFDAGAVIYGLPNGDLHIRSRDGKRLWKWF